MTSERRTAAVPRGTAAVEATAIDLVISVMGGCFVLAVGHIRMCPSEETSGAGARRQSSRRADQTARCRPRRQGMPWCNRDVGCNEQRRRGEGTSKRWAQKSGSARKNLCSAASGSYVGTIRKIANWGSEQRRKERSLPAHTARGGRVDGKGGVRRGGSGRDRGAIEGARTGRRRRQWRKCASASSSSPPSHWCTFPVLWCTPNPLTFRPSTQTTAPPT